MEKEFNLLEEPWLLALTQNGERRAYSLMDLLSNAHLLRSLAGEMAAQDIAVLRLLLAVLYAVYGREKQPKNERDAVRRWEELWQAGQFPREPLLAYFGREDIKDKFYLFHPSHPFFQAAVQEGAQVMFKGQLLFLNPLRRKMYSFIGDICDSDLKPNLFSYRKENLLINYSEAARWLVHMNSFDVSPLGRPPKEGYKANGYSVPWPNTLGLVWAEGENLFETLMLNFVLFPPNRDAYPAFTPSWERENIFDPQELTQVDATFPKEPCALFSFPFRRLLLKRNAEGLVDECVLLGGQLVNADSGNPLTETMTLWRKDKSGRHIPQKHDPSRQMWRDFPSLLGSKNGINPGVVDWLALLQEEEAPVPSTLRLSIGGLVLSSQMTSVDDTVQDSLRFNAALLNNLEDGWVPRIGSELALTDKMVQKAGYLAQELVMAGGGSGESTQKSVRAKAMEQAYFLLDAPFRDWLSGIHEEDSMDEAFTLWRKTQFQVLAGFGEELVKRAGAKALIGREVSDRVYTAPSAFNKYMAMIHKLNKE